ncbi:MAG TPA: hypothetical protein VEB21_20585 [Terriglobales bacterium]|nr:hypothetical protein [Terriglobales bacterium]
MHHLIIRLFATTLLTAWTAEALTQPARLMPFHWSGPMISRSLTGYTR